MTRRAAASILFLTALLFAGVLGADEDGQGVSAAETAFRGAWWAETSESRLDEAAHLYEQAAQAEGPDDVRARSLYRLGVVLERMGRTEDAIQALERLAQAYPGQSELQTKARARLEEWTAVDLKTGFAEWYQRYQYSPEFQARIVELVLALSNSDPSSAKVSAASDELLTIGAPAIPALRAHTSSSNPAFRERVVDLLMKLGEIPDAGTLAATWAWQRTSGNWRLLLQAPAETKAALLEALGEIGESERADTLAMVLGPSTGWVEAARRAKSEALLWAIFAQAALDDALVADVKSLVDEGSDLEGYAARALHRRGYATDEDLFGWLRDSTSSEVVCYVARHLAGLSEPLPGALDTVIARMASEAPRSDLLRDLQVALVATVGDEPSDVRLRAAVRAMEHGWPGGYLQIPLPTHYRSNYAGVTEHRDQLLQAAIMQYASDPKLVLQALSAWNHAHEGDPRASLQLLAWADMPLDPDNRLRAAVSAGRAASPATLDALLAAVPGLEPALQAEVWSGLAKHRTLQGLPWSDERVLSLLQIASEFEGTFGGSRLGRLVKVLFGTQHRIDQFVRLALEKPRAIRPGLVALLDKDLRRARATVQRVREGFPGTWRDGDLDKRRAMLEVFPSLWGTLSKDDAFTAFLRGELQSDWSTSGSQEDARLEREVKGRVLLFLPSIDLDDVRAVFDLADPEQAAAAAGFARLPRTEAVYDALAAGRRASDKARERFWSTWQEVSEPLAFRRRIHRDMAEDPGPGWRRTAVARLGELRNGQDVDVLRGALTDDDDNVRTAAAEALAHVYDEQAIEALVAALDDDHPYVRDAALRTLETIRAIEEKKAYWRDRVRNE